MLAAYSPGQVSLSWNGIAITGFAPDSAIRLKRREDLIKKTVGMAGDVSITRSADRTGEVEVELLQTSKSNILLSAVALAMEKTGTIPVGALLINDPSGSVLGVGINCWLMKLPDVDLGSDQHTKTWVFGCENLSYSAVPDEVGFMTV